MKEKPPEDIYSKSVDVDFDDPRIQELMRKTEALRLDQRGQQPTRAVLIRPARDPQGKTTVCTQIGEENAGQVILASSQLLAAGEDVVLYRREDNQGGIYRVQTSRPGRRQEDAAQNIFITYLQRQA